MTWCWHVTDVPSAVVHNLIPNLRNSLGIWKSHHTRDRKKVSEKLARCSDDVPITAGRCASNTNPSIFSQRDRYHRAKNFILNKYTLVISQKQKSSANLDFIWIQKLKFVVSIDQSYFSVKISLWATCQFSEFSSNLHRNFIEISLVMYGRLTQPHCPDFVRVRHCFLIRNSFFCRSDDIFNLKIPLYLGWTVAPVENSALFLLFCGLRESVDGMSWHYGGIDTDNGGWNIPGNFCEFS